MENEGGKAEFFLSTARIEVHPRWSKKNVPTVVQGWTFVRGALVLQTKRGQVDGKGIESPSVGEWRFMEIVNGSKRSAREEKNGGGDRERST